MKETRTREACRLPVAKLRGRSPRMIDGKRLILNERGRSRIGKHVAFAYTPPEIGDPLTVLVGDDRRPRIVVGPPRTYLRSVPADRIYLNSLVARLCELRYQVPRAAKFDDLSIAARLLAPKGNASLPGMIERFLPEETGAELLLLRSASMSEDVRQTLNESLAVRILFEDGGLLQQIKEQGLEYVYRDIELPVVEPTARMMHEGMLLDVKRTTRRRNAAQQHLKKIKATIVRITGSWFDPCNPREIEKQLGNLGVSLSNRQQDLISGSLSQLVDVHPVIKLIVDYRKCIDRQRWADTLLRNRCAATGRIHCTLDPLGADTGRFTCTNPSLHNLPQDMRNYVISGPDRVLIEVDYSQFELRVLAHFTQDPVLLSTFRKRHGDIHRETAAILFGVPSKNVTTKQRVLGKTVNFGIVFGQTKHGLARTTGMSVDAAQRLLDRFFRKFQRVGDWIEECRNHVEQTGQVRSLYGRRRLLPDATKGWGSGVEHALRQAVNSVIQGTAADINKLALIRLYEALPPDCHLLLSVHDSVLVETPLSKASEVAKLVRSILETPPPDFSVPLFVTTRVSRSWGGTPVRPANK